MTINTANQKIAGITLMEIIVVIGLLVILAAMLPVSTTGGKRKAQRTQCANNLSQIQKAFRVWPPDQSDSYPMFVSTNNGGTAEFTNSLEVYPHFQVMAAELGQHPKVLICPADDERKPADLLTTNSVMHNENISYFIGLGANDNFPQSIVTGDRNVSDTNTIKHGFFARGTNEFVQWTLDMHSAGNTSGAGNIALGDGSVQQVTSAALRDNFWRYSGFPTNRLILP